jgi:DNA-binding MarR family transcriptional regulator
MTEIRASARAASRFERTPEAELLTDIIVETFGLNGGFLDVGDKITKDLGLSSARWQVLASADGEKRTVADIARRMGLRRQSVQRTVNSLLRNDFVLLQPNPNHRRAKLVELTEKGHSALEEIFRRQADWANSVSQGLSADDLKRARQLMATIKARLE